MATRLNSDVGSSDQTPKGFCACACHLGGLIVHPVPCCAPCPRCQLGIPTGVAHECRGPLHPDTLRAHGRVVVREFASFDLVFSGFVAVLVMAVAILALPLQGSLVLLAAAAGGIALGVALVIWRTSRRDRAEVHRDEA